MDFFPPTYTEVSVLLKNGVIAIHPINPILFTGSWDGQIKLWNWDTNWSCIKTLSTSGGITQIRLNQTYPAQLASVSLDKKIKIWNISNKESVTIGGHEDIVNSVTFVAVGQTTHLAFSADNFTIKLWNCKTKKTTATLHGIVRTKCQIFFKTTSGTMLKNYD